MPKGYRRFACKTCGKPKSEVGRLSARGKCDHCGDTRVVENNRQLRAHAGPHFDHWRKRLLASFGVGLAAESEPADVDARERAA